MTWLYEMAGILCAISEWIQDFIKTIKMSVLHLSMNVLPLTNVCQVFISYYLILLDTSYLQTVYMDIK